MKTTEKTRKFKQSLKKTIDEMYSYIISDELKRALWNRRRNRKSLKNINKP